MKKSEIREIWSEIAKSKCSPGIDHLTLSHIKNKKLDERYINHVYYALKGKEDYAFSKYKQLLKIKGRGKAPRVISIPTIRDRLMLKSLLNYLHFIKRPKVNNIVSNISEISSSGEYDSYLKLDISKFYDSIDINLLILKLKKKIANRYVINIIKSALLVNTVDDKNNSADTPRIKKEEFGVPQGIIVSNSLAEFYLNDVDLKLSKSKNFKYYRFVDDILIFFKSDKITECELKDIVAKELDLLGLKLNESKTKSDKTEQGFDFIGYEFDKEIVRPRKDSIRNEEKKLERIIFDFKNCSNSHMKSPLILEWKLRVHICGFVNNGKAFGWVQMYHKVNDETVFHKLDWLVKKLLKRAGYYKKIITYSYSKSFNYLKNGNLKYSVNFDSEYKTIQQKRSLLIKLFGIKKSTTSYVVSNLFHSLVSKTIYETEKDLDFKYAIS